jgi:hypothetical protein
LTAFTIASPFIGAQLPRFSADNDIRQLPSGKVTRPDKRRMVALRQAREAIDHLPASGETVHLLLTGCFDLAHLLTALLDALGSPCQQMRIATLSLSSRNVAELAGWLDSDKVGRLDVLVSHFFWKNDRPIFTALLQEMGQRGQRVAAARSHCKIITMLLADGRAYAAEGSANLRSNGNVEQLALSRDAALFGFYDAWLAGMVSKHEIHESDNPAAC